MVDLHAKELQAAAFEVVLCKRRTESEKGREQEAKKEIGLQRRAPSLSMPQRD